METVLILYIWKQLVPKNAQQAGSVFKKVKIWKMMPALCGLYQEVQGSTQADSAAEGNIPL